MSAWIISLPVVVGLAATILVMVAAGLGTYQLILRVPAGSNDDSDGYASMVSSGAASYAILGYLPRNGADESATRVADHIRRVVGVLLGLMLSTVFAFSSAQYVKNQDSIEVEAAQLGDLYHDLSRIGSLQADAAARLIREYIEAVVRDEWPALAMGIRSAATDRLFLSIEDQLIALSAKSDEHKQLKSRMLQDIDEISDLRQSRIYSAGAGLDWYILLVILCFVLPMTTFRFFTPTRWTRFYLMSYAVLIAIVLYSTVAMNYPFHSGLVSPQPFESLNATIEN